MLAGIFCTAYAFVPGASIFRERTHLVLLVASALLAFGELKTIRVPVTYVGKTLRRRIYTTTGLFFAFGAFIANSRAPPFVQPFNAGDRVVTAGIWCLHFGLEGNLRESQRRIRQTLFDAELDIVGFLESDLQHIVMGNRDSMCTFR